MVPSGRVTTEPPGIAAYLTLATGVGAERTVAPIEARRRNMVEDFMMKNSS